VNLRELEPGTAERKLGEPILAVDGISLAFGGVKALSDVSFDVREREVRAIIGPNGAGKTTMMDVITGKTRPDSGEVFFQEGAYDLSKLDETEIAGLGIGRKFQKPTVFEMHTVEDNLQLALKNDRRVRATLLWQSSEPQEKRIDQVLDTIRLRAVRSRVAGSLSHGQKQWLEIGMLLAQEPKLLLVDEPVAGMTDLETRQTAELLRQINRDKTVVVVEHDMAFVRDLGVKVTCLHEGSVLAEGSIDQVSQNDRVVEVYLGR
jgi:urea transport system ATP-binding protein